VQVGVFGTARSPHFSLVIISATVQLWIQVFWVISVYFNIRNTLPKSGTFLLRHPVYAACPAHLLIPDTVYLKPALILFPVKKLK